jgi:sorting nexin-1/2
MPFCKIPDEDEVLVGKKLYFEDLDIKLKNIHKVVDSLIRERKDLGEYCKELAEKFNELALLEKNEALSKKLEKISKIHSILKDAHDAQVNNELKHIAGVLEEYIRTIGSVKVAYAIRLKVHTNNNNLDVIYQKKLETITRLEQSSKVRVDKISAAKSEYLETSKAMESSSTDFQQITHRLIKDIDRIEQMKLEDFAQSTKRYLSLMIESQQKIVTAWQSYSQ